MTAGETAVVLSGHMTPDIVDRPEPRPFCVILTAKPSGAVPKDSEETENMASPQAERESVPEGIFIRYATVHDVNDIKAHLNRQDSQMVRQDVRMDRQDDRIDVIVSDVSEIKARQNGQDVKIDGLISDIAEIKLRQNAQSGKMDALSEEVSQLRVRVGGLETRVGGLETRVGNVETAVVRLEAKVDKRHAHMYRLLYTLIGAAVIGCGLLARIAFF